MFHTVLRHRLKELKPSARDKKKQMKLSCRLFPFFSFKFALKYQCRPGRSVTITF